jgi:hypothetical protein
MKFLHSARWLLLALVIMLIPVSSHAGVFISVGIAPPELPVYVQPDCPEPGLMWMPGYWAYGDDGYYWVPGAWVPAPYQGALWTPGYWGWSDGFYVFHPGYWGRHVGYYGGVNYGYGYGGFGFAGGEWRGGVFAYNTFVMHVDRRYIHETFEDRGRVERGFVARDSHVAFSGGPGGIRYHPRPEERVAEHERHTSVTSYQQQHEAAARSDRGSYVKNNGGHPSTLAVPRPLGANKNAAPSADRGKSGHDNWNAPTKSQGPGVGAKPQGPGAGKEGVLNYNSPKSNTGNAVGQPRTMGGSSPKGDTTVKGSGVPQNNMHTMPPAHTESQPHPQGQQFQPRSQGQQHEAPASHFTPPAHTESQPHPQGQQFQPRSQGQQHEAPATHFTPPAHTESQPHPQGQQLQPHSQGQQHEAPASHSAPKDKDEHKHN